MFTSGLRVAWGTVFTVCCIPGKLELGLERAEEVSCKGYNNNKSISGYLIVSFNSNTREHPFFRIFNLLLDIQIKLLIASR